MDRSANSYRRLPCALSLRDAKKKKGGARHARTPTARANWCYLVVVRPHSPTSSHVSRLSTILQRAQPPPGLANRVSAHKYSLPPRWGGQ
eukprot:2881825-Prymnesium_polylepis.1